MLNVSCALKKETLLAYHGGTTSMKNHLSSHHPSCLSASEVTCSSVQSLDNFTVQKKCPAERSKEITKRIAEMVARDLRPLSLVEGEGFKRLMNYVEPGYTVPSHTHVTTICRRMYSELKEKLILEIAS
uniref:BED-type domain-containing protein n=1 Tax=Amphimedon queenslandica TaxID=400682 RepID=A0A1X7SFL6_AMPQE